MSETQFKVGDKVVYPTQGVAEVVDIESKEIAGTRQTFYVLHLLGTNRKVLVPIKNAEAVGVRALIGKGDTQRIFDILRGQGEAPAGAWHKRYKSFQELIKTGKLKNIAAVLRDLSQLEKSQAKLSFGESQLRRRAREMLVTEIAIARDQPEQLVLDEVDAAFA